jgi:hypothetical protein
MVIWRRFLDEDDSSTLFLGAIHERALKMEGDG